MSVVQPVSADTNCTPTPTKELVDKVNSSSINSQIWRLYSSFFMRQPDLGGFDYWIDIRSNYSQEFVAQLFSESSEFQNRYGSLSDKEYIDQIYLNVLCRKSDSEGLHYWLSLLEKNELNRGEVMIYFSESIEYLDKTGTGYGMFNLDKEPRITSASFPKSEPDSKDEVNNDEPTVNDMDVEEYSDHSETLIWADEFNALENHWRVEHSTYGAGNNEVQCYRPANTIVDNGYLVLLAKEESGFCKWGKNHRDYSSGMVRGDINFSPGQAMEWKVKLTPADEDNQAGLWPALWSSGWTGESWPTGGEWDGFEVMTANSPNRVVNTIHFSDETENHRKIAGETWGNRFSDSWHEFRFEYHENGVLVWYMDGIETHRVENGNTIQGWPAPFDSTMTEIKLNLALGGNPGSLDERALPATLMFDYIRIYQMD